MIHYSLTEDITYHISDKLSFSSSCRHLILIGGCSRSGKSTLSNELHETFISNGFQSVIINLDSWLIGFDKRPKNSKVYQRYEVSSIIKSINTLLSGEKIYPPVYNAKTRRRITEKREHPIQVEKGFIIIDGVISLYINELTAISSLNIFVRINDISRIKRLIEFYSVFKGMQKTKYHKIIRDRESEEVPFIKNTASNADIIYTK